jgi:hypothetical protein
MKKKPTQKAWVANSQDAWSAVMDAYKANQPAFNKYLLETSSSYTDVPKSGVVFVAPLNRGYKK